MMVGREGGRGQRREMCGKTSGLCLCVWERERDWVFAGGQKQNPSLRACSWLLIHCMPVEKGSLAGFLSALLKKLLLSEAFTALNVKTSMTAHTPKVSEAEADWWLLTWSSLRCISVVLPECTGTALGCGQAVVPSLLSCTPKLTSEGRGFHYCKSLLP